VLKILERTLKHLLSLALRALLPRGVVPIPERAQVHRVLVIRQHNQLGDMLCAVPLLRALRTAYPAATITLVASPVNADVMRGGRYIDSLVVYDKTSFVGGGRIHPLRLFTFIGGLRREKFDIALVPMTVSVSFTSCLLAFLSGARIRIGAGRIDGKENPSAAFLTRPIDLDWRNDPHRHQTLRNLDTARELALPEVDLGSEITLTREESEKGSKWVARELTGWPSAVGFHPGAGKIPNRWPPDRFAHVANEVSSRLHARVFVTKGPMDEEPVAEMMGRLLKPPVVVANKPIREVAAILARMDLVISNDTGIMHVAAAVGVPVLSLFGPTEPRQWAPPGAGHMFLWAGRDIREITTEEVLTCALELLKRKGLV
jgi:ADP-heptose:LPS heptosyltransferase